MKKLIKRKVLLTTKFFDVTDNDLIDSHGHRVQRLLVEHGGSTVVLPLDENNRVLLVSQYRFPAKAAMWELPAGKVDPGETPLQAAKRELIEETGLRAKRWKKLITYFPSPGFQEEKMSIFLANGLVPGEKPHIEDEHLQERWIDADKLEALIKSGKITDGKTIIGMYFLRLLQPRL